MTIKDIFIDGFGTLKNISLTGFSRGINIITGRNEAGKSTLQKFIRYTLFGYPGRMEERMPPTEGGVHGGRIKCQLSGGEEVVFERKAASRGGDINLTYQNTSSKNQTQWLQFLGNATKDLYYNVYAFSLDELVQLDSLQSSGVEDKLFSLGLGLGNTSIGGIESTVENFVDDIYTPRGSKKVLPQLLTDFLSKRTLIQKIQNELPLYIRLNHEIDLLQTEIDRLDGDLKKNREDLGRFLNYQKCYDSFVDIQVINQKLISLPPKMGYPENGIEQLNKLEEEEFVLTEKIKTLTEGTPEEPGLNNLQQEIACIILNEELLKQDAKLSFLLSNLQKYKQAKRDKSEDDQKIQRLKDSNKEGLQLIDPRWQMSDIRNFGNTIQHKDKISGFKQGRNELNEKRISLEAKESALGQSQSTWNALAVGTTIAFILLALAIAAGLYKLFVAAGIFGILALIIFWRRRAHANQENPLARVRNQLKDLREREEPAYQKEYQDYLVSILHIDGSLSADAVLEVLSIIEELKRKIIDLDSLESKNLVERMPYILAYEQEADALRGFVDEQWQANTIEEIVSSVGSKFNQTKHGAERKMRLEELAGQKKRQVESLTTELDATLTGIPLLLAVIGAADSADYRKKYYENSEVKSLVAEKEGAKLTIEKIAGIGKFTDVSEFLASHEKLSLNEEVFELEKNIQDMDRQKLVKSSTRGEKIAERDRIEGESALAQHLTELETQKEKLNRQYRNWVAGKLALKILAEVKAKYERDKQPAVIRQSGSYFSGMTCDKYKRISVSLEGKEVLVYDSMEAAKRIDQLSRGTKEQLLISLRLGFIEEYEKQLEPLPVIVDEIFVNFDQERLRETARLLHDFAQTRQVLIFTCHPAIRDCFGGMNINAIEL